MSKQPPVTIHRKDYTAPAYWVNTVEMGFDLDPAATRVATRITLQRNSASPNKDVELLGDGAKLVALCRQSRLLGMVQIIYIDHKQGRKYYKASFMDINYAKANLSRQLSLCKRGT